jgi:hypothetical protein
MAVTVGTLIVDLQANTASFVSGLDKAGQISLTSMNNIEKAFTSMAATAGAAITAVEGALAALLDQQVNNAARLYDMAQATGVSVDALSGLEYVAKQSGISAESLDKALEKLGKSLDKAVSGGVNSTNAFKTLGVTITDANGKLLPTTTILESLANKFQSFKDGPEKTALAIQIFGKAGADLVPLLNRGSAGIDDLLKEAQRLGVVIGDDTASAAKQFQESMNKVTAAVEGAANSMLTKLLPSIQMVIDNVAAGAEETDSRFKDVLNAAGVVGKAFIVAFGAVQTFFDSLGNFIKHLGAETIIVFQGLGDAAGQALKGNFAGATSDIKQMNSALEANNKASLDEQTKLWKEYGDGVVAFWNATTDKIAKKPITGTANAPAPPSKDQANFTAMVEKQIIALQSAADKTALLAVAQKGSSAATIEGTAAAEANSEIEKLNAEAVQKHVNALTDKQKARILDAATEKAFATVANEVSKTLADETFKTNEQTKAVLDMGAAFGQGATAIQAATDKAKIDPLREKVDQLQQEFTKLSTSGRASGAELQKLSADLANATTQYNNAVTAIQKLAAAQRATATTEAVTNLDRQATAAIAYSAAVLNGAAALRAFNVEQAVLAYTRNPSLDQSTDAVNKYRAAVIAAQQADLQKSTAEKVASLANLGNIQDEIDALNKLASTTKLTDEQQLALDALIHDAELKKQKDMDDLLLKTNSVSNGFKVFFDQYTKDGQTAAQAVSTVMKSTIDDFTNTIVNGLTKGKFAFSDFVASVQAMLLKLALNQLFKSLIGLGLGFLNNSNFFSSLGGGTIFGSGGVFGGGHASGGDVNAGTAYLVGERGQEMFVPKTAGTIIPNDALQHVNAAGQPQGKGTNVYQTFNIMTPNPDAFRQSQDQVTSTGLNAAMRAARRNG